MKTLKQQLESFRQDFQHHTGMKVSSHQVYSDVMLELDATHLDVPAMKSISQYLERKFHVDGQYNGVTKKVGMQPSSAHSGYCLGVRIGRRELERVFG